MIFYVYWNNTIFTYAICKSEYIQINELVLGRQSFDSQLAEAIKTYLQLKGVANVFPLWPRNNS